MRFYKHTHAFYAGVDLHARSMFTHILDHAGNTVFEADLPASPDAFRKAIAPYRAGLVVGCECMFSWYWLADLCEDDEIPFTLGHALYMKAIHGGKAKNDRIDAGKIAGLLRGGMFPMAYVYPRAKRDTRDLLRRRCFFVNQRAQLRIDEGRQHWTGSNSGHRSSWSCHGRGKGNLAATGGFGFGGKALFLRRPGVLCFRRDALLRRGYALT